MELCVLAKFPANANKNAESYQHFSRRCPSICSPHNTSVIFYNDYPQEYT